MRTIRYLSLFVVIAAATVLQAAVAGETDATPKSGQKESGAESGKFEFSKAEKKLWLSDHLANINSKGRLHYEFKRSGSFEQGFSDSVYLDIVGVNKDGTKNTDLEFFSGARKIPARPNNLKEVRGNPVLGVYMQGDVHEMERLTDGSWRYFQRRIKFAFANDARVEEVTIDHNGDSISAEKITIRPYRKDPNRREFEKFANKVYEFTLSSQIPGGIYQIKTVIPNQSNPDGEPLILEKLTFQRADFKS